MKTRQNQIENFIHGAGIGLIGRFIGRFLNILGNVWIARYLGPVMLGVYSIGLALFRILETIVPLGFDFGVIKYGMEFYGRKRSVFKGVLLVAFVVPLTFSVGMGILLYFFSPWLAMTVFKDERLIIVFHFVAFLLPLASLLYVVAAATRITHNIQYSVITQDLGQPLFAIIFLVIFISVGASLKGILWANILSYLISVGIIFFLLFRVFPFLGNVDVDWGIPIVDYFHYSFSSTITIVLGTALFWVDRFLIGVFLSADKVGYYQAASQLIVVFAVILSGLSKIIVPVVSSLQKENTLKDIEEIYRVGTKWVIYLSIPILVILFYMPEDVLMIFYGSEYRVGKNILLVLLIGQIINLMTGPIAPVLMTLGYQKHMLFFSFLALCLNIFLGIFLIPRVGGEGMAIAFSISTSFVYLSFLFVAIKLVKITPYDMRLFKGFMATLATYGTVYIGGKILNGKPFVDLIVLSFLSMVGFWGTIYFLRFDKEDVLFIDMVKSLTGK